MRQALSGARSDGHLHVKPARVVALLSRQVIACGAQPNTIQRSLSKYTVPQISKDIPAFRREYRKSGSVRSSALAAGYSQNVANMGMKSLPKSVRTYVLTRQKKLSKLAQLAKQITAEDQENTVRGALLANVASGKDQAVNSLKLLGQDRRVDMWKPESAQGIIVIQAASIPSFDAVPSIDSASETSK